MVRIFTLLTADDEGYRIDNIPVYMELSAEHLEEINNAIKFVDSSTMVTKVSVCLNAPTPPKFVVLDEMLVKSCKDYSYLYARVFRNGNVTFGAEYIENLGHVSESYYYFAESFSLPGYIKDDSVLISGDLIEECLGIDINLLKSIRETLGEEIFSLFVREADISPEELEEIGIKEWR